MRSKDYMTALLQCDCEYKINVICCHSYCNNLKHTKRRKIMMTSQQQTQETKTKQLKQAMAVVTAEEVGRIIDLGLGRGIDATNPSPWLNKSSFQIRRVTIENIIGTEEGGAQQSYETEIASVTTTQTDLKASIAVPQASVNFGLEGELSRSVTKTRKALGKRVVNRTISFRADFDDVPQTVCEDDTIEKVRAESISPNITYTVTDIDGKNSEDQDDDVAESTHCAHVSDLGVELLQSKFTFEERLSKFILERALRRFILKKKKAEEQSEKPPDEPCIDGDNALEDMTHYLNQIDKEETKKIVEDCADFVRHFRITHYVSSIQLGASQYRIVNETEYYTRVSSGGTFGFEKLANVAVRASGSKKLTKKASDLRKIGQIVNEKVERGSYDEAVVGIQIQPIHTLVKLRFLHLAMRKVLLDYIDEQENNSSGPFIVGCSDEPIYWKVNKRNNYAVEATSNIHEASDFYIIPIDDGSNSFEFNIGWQGDRLPKHLRRNLSTILTPLNTRYVEPLFRYLDANVSVLGTNPGPLCLREELDASYSRLTLHQRIIGRRLIPVDTKDWIQGRDQYFMGCSRRRFKKYGFVAVKRLRHRRRRQGVNDPEFITSCVSSEDHHNGRYVYMLFRILSPLIRDKGDKRNKLVDGSEGRTSKQEEKINREFESYLGAVKDVTLKLPLASYEVPRGKQSSNDKHKMTGAGTARKVAFDIKSEPEVTDHPDTIPLTHIHKTLQPHNIHD